MAFRLSPTDLLAVLQPWTEVAEAIHQRLAQLTEIEQAHDVLWVGAGSGRSVLWWAERFQTHTVGVDPDSTAIEHAEAAARASGLGSLVAFQTGDPTDLPFEAHVFDLVVADVFHLRGQDNRRVVLELGRVARPMATVIALVPVWLESPEPKHIKAIESLGIHPRVIVEWKRWLREAHAVELVAEGAALDGAWLAYGLLGLMVRAWRVARWSGVRTVLGREVRALRSLARRRVLGCSIIKGTRWPHEE